MIIRIFKLLTMIAIWSNAACSNNASVVDNFRKILGDRQNHDDDGSHGTHFFVNAICGPLSSL